jgi:hypothetical protein
LRIVKLTFICAMSLLMATAVEAANGKDSKEKTYFQFAQEAFGAGQTAEETAKLSFYTTDVAEYYELAIKNYKLALKEAQTSMEFEEPLDEDEIKVRNTIISDSTRKIKICQNKFEDATYRKYYDNALRDFEIGQEAEEKARFFSSPLSRADYYQIAIKNYQNALKLAQRSTEELEELSQKEQYERERLMAECRERVEICQMRFTNANIDSTLEDLRQQGHKYVVAGFNYIIAGNQGRAKSSWNEALRIYNEALLYMNEDAAREVIKSKVSAVKKYLEYCQ